METINFLKNGELLKVIVVYKSTIPIYSSYDLSLFEAKSNSLVVVSDGDFSKNPVTGNNSNEDDDKYTLPAPVDSNNDRIIELFSVIRNDNNQDVTCDVIIKIFQGSKDLKEVKESFQIGKNSTHVKVTPIKFIEKEKSL